MHDASQEPSDPTNHSIADSFEPLDLARLQLLIAHLGLAKQELENLGLKLELAQQRQEAAQAEVGRFNTFLKQKYNLAEGVDRYNYATGAIERGGGGEAQ